MEEFSLELECRRLIGIIVVEVHLETEGAALPYGIECAVDNCFPLVKIVLVRHGIDAFIVTLLDLLALLHQLTLRVRSHPCIYSDLYIAGNLI